MPILRLFRLLPHRAPVFLLGGAVVAVSFWGFAGIWRSHRLASAWAAWCGPTRAQTLDLWGQGQLQVSHVACAVVFGSASLVFWGWIARQWWLQRQARSGVSWAFLKPDPTPSAGPSRD